MKHACSVALVGLFLLESSAFHPPAGCVPVRARRNPGVHCCAPPQEPPPEMTKVGSKAYYEGFFTQPVDENVTAERGDGTEQAIKFAASSLVVIAILFLGFMVSNGLLG